MTQTQYEIHGASLDQSRVTRVITSPTSGAVIAQGVSAPYANAPTPCAVEFYKLNPPNSDYVFTDALTGCAGFIAVSGDLSASGAFIPSQALVIHDKGGDRLASSGKLIEDFIRAEHQAGHGRMRLIWGNGVVREKTDPTHTLDAERVVRDLALRYPHLDIKRLPDQMALVIDKQGRPINLAGTPLCTKPTMEELCLQDPVPIATTDLIDLDFDRAFQRAHIPVRPVATAADPAKVVGEALSQGRFPPIWLANEARMKVLIENSTSKIPTSGDEGRRYRELAQQFEHHPTSQLLQTIGAQLETYRTRYIAYNTAGRTADPAQAKLMGRKWWALLCMATELKDGLDGKPVRRQLLDKSFFKEHIPTSMDGHLSKTTANLVERADREFLLSHRDALIDGSLAPGGPRAAAAQEEDEDRERTGDSRHL
jgi:type II secretory pathway pseudopilin PulG